MELNYLLYIQILIDILLFVAIVVLVWQLKRKIDQTAVHADRPTITDLKAVMVDSEQFVNQYMKSIDENKDHLTKLIRQLDDKERKMVLLIEEADNALQKFDRQKKVADSPINDQYENISEMARQGLTVEEIAKRSGISEGEVNLVVELAKAGKNDGT